MSEGTLQLPFRFGQNFLQEHASHIIADPKIAVTELIANAYDAGATQVKVQWPEQAGELLAIIDNGCGMTAAEFEKRWHTFSYNRLQEQGPAVTFPPGVRHTPRTAFGQNGKGRYGAFCFSDSYSVETWRAGSFSRWSVHRLDSSTAPFQIRLIEKGEKEGHGTRLQAVVNRKLIPREQIAESLGAKFLVDPSFSITINEEMIQLEDLGGLQTEYVDVPGYGELIIHLLDSGGLDGTTRLQGITWWVNGRRVGEPAWHTGDGVILLDGRKTVAKRYSFVVVADILKPQVKADWSGFHGAESVNAVRKEVEFFVMKTLDDVQETSRRDRKRQALIENGQIVRDLPPMSRTDLGRFMDQVMEKCPRLSQEDLTRTAEIFAQMEKAKSGYALLRQLAACSPSDIDSWNRLMKAWTATNAEIVLFELGRRLELISKLEKLVKVKTTDELHELQPLFERGLWMFGPEYEGVTFTSNRQMATVIRHTLGGTEQPISRSRPDFVALPDTSIGVYSADGYDEVNEEVSGYSKLLIVELKKGGFAVTKKEQRQADDYAQELQNADLVDAATQIEVIVLGEDVHPSAKVDLKRDPVRVRAMRYDRILQRAHNRTFNLQRRLKDTYPAPDMDTDVESVYQEVSRQASLEFGDV